MRRVVSLLLLGALGTSACAAKVSATELITKSPGALVEKGTSKIAMDIEFSTTTSGQAFEFRMTGEGEQDYVARKARLEFSFVGEDIPALGPQETIVDGNFVYTKAPCQSGPLAGKTWVKFDQRQATGINPTSSASNDPTTFLEGLRGAENIKEVGVEKVRGVSTTHYTMTIDPKKALEQLTPERREQVSALFGSFGPGIPADVWIDEDGLPRKYSASFESGAEAPAAFKMKMTFESYDYGTRVDAQIPPEDQVYLVTDPAGLGTICFPTPPKG